MSTTEHVEAEFVDDAPASGTGLAVVEYALPSVTPQEARTAMAAYQELCESILSDDDYQEFSQKKKVNNRWISETKRFKKKSAVKKLQTFFGVEVSIRETVKDDLPDGHYAFRVIASAKSKGGRIVEASGGCSTLEDRFDPNPFDESSERYAQRRRKALARAYHDVLSTAETRATNRAVMNAIGVGGGEVTADEVQRDRKDEPRREDPPPPVEIDRAAYNRRVFSKLKTLAELSPEHAALADDDRRHDALEKLYAKRSLKDLTDDQLRDFERRVDSLTLKARQGAA